MDSDTELNILRKLVKNTAAHLRTFNELDSELTEFCSYADDIDEAFDADYSDMVMPPVEDDTDEEVDGSDTIILED